MNNKQNLPLLRGHLSYKAQRWPLYTGLTVYCIVYWLCSPKRRDYTAAFPNNYQGGNIARSQVVQDHLNLAWTPENFHIVAKLATDVLNVTCAKSVSGSQEFWLGY
jgi:hypothetical protein